MNTKKLTCGTFAKLCNTTKETLFHYDKIGLLKPEFIGKNNYRYYAPEQFFLFNFIETLTDSDTPLKEIKSQIKNFNADSFIGFLRQKQEYLKQKRLKLALKEELINDLLNEIEDIKTSNYETVRLINKPSETFIAFKTNVSAVASYDDLSEHLSRFFTDCCNKNIFLQSTFGFIIEKKNFDKELKASYICAKALKGSKQALRYTLPKGTYASVTILGDKKAHLNGIKRLEQHLKELGYFFAGDLIALDRFSLLYHKEKNEFAVKYLIYVKKDKNNAD